jgi:hypothetical protein
VILGGIEQLAGDARGRVVRRRGQSVGDDHHASDGQLLGTLVRHAFALPAPVVALAIAVIVPTLRARLVAGVGAGVRHAIALHAADFPAVDLPPIAEPADVEDLPAPAAALLS